MGEDKLRGFIGMGREGEGECDLLLAWERNGEGIMRFVSMRRKGAGINGCVSVGR